MKNILKNIEVSGVDRKFLIKNKLIPFESHDNSISFYSTRNDDFNTYSNIKYITDKECKIKLVEETVFQNYLEIYEKYFIKNSGISIFKYESADEKDNREIIDFLNHMIEEAIKLSVSDIHIEPFEKSIRVRYRIDGHLKTYYNLDNEFKSVIVTRFKIISGLDIAERRLPQDGRITFKYKNRNIDLRISTMPSIYGEKIELRILDSDYKFTNLRSLGMPEGNLNSVKGFISKLQGLILVCGPTGSGKTSTIYSILNELNSEDLNITTIEDPVEYKIDGITQIQVNHNTGLEFENTLNHILRQDPDIIGIGEIRNKETATTCLRAAITGHLVLSTIHTDNSINAIFRLKDIGCEPYIIANSLKLVISQRLVRRLCDHCKIIDESENNLFSDDIKIYKANKSGCEFCNNGYKERIAVFEMLKIDDSIKNLISENKGYEEILEAARKNGYKTIQEEYKKYLAEGKTSLEEIIRLD